VCLERSKKHLGHATRPEEQERAIRIGDRAARKCELVGEIVRAGVEVTDVRRHGRKVST